MDSIADLRSRRTSWISASRAEALVLDAEPALAPFKALRHGGRSARHTEDTVASGKASS